MTTKKNRWFFARLTDHACLCAVLAFVAVSPLNAEPPATDWRDLFDGSTLDGWVQKNGTATYRVIDGSLVGTTVDGSWNSFLCTEKEYGDFEIEFDVKVDGRLNSGVQIRSKTREQTIGKGPNNAAGRVIGPQVEIEASRQNGAEAGYIYAEATGLGWRTPKERLIPHKRMKDGQWNELVIIAQGPKLVQIINGVVFTELVDRDAKYSAANGVLAFQDHGKGTVVEYKDIRLSTK